jgi:hypothetical protein
MLWKLPLRHPDHFAGVIEEHRAGTGRALIEREDIPTHVKGIRSARSRCQEDPPRRQIFLLISATGLGMRGLPTNELRE